MFLESFSWMDTVSAHARPILSQFIFNIKLQAHKSVECIDTIPAHEWLCTTLRGVSEILQMTAAPCAQRKKIHVCRGVRFE